MNPLRLYGTALAVAAVASAAAAVYARPRILREFVARYPHVTGTKLQNCTTCHSPKPTELNSYGKALKDAALKFAAIERLDSDKDGASNVAEIRAHTYPGDPKDRPGLPAVADSSADSTKVVRPDSSEARRDTISRRGGPADTTRQR